MTRLLALVGLALLPALAPAAEKTPPSSDKARAAAETYAVKQSLDIAYVEGGGWRQKLDVFSPKGAEGECFPVVIFAHGGTWLFGGKNFFGTYRKVGQNLARYGVVTVMINYRLSPLVKHPEHVKDMASAYAWTEKNIEKYGGDPDRVILSGHSAGGHLAALLAADPSYLKDPKLKLTDRQRKGVKGVVCLSGVYRVPGEDDYKEMMQPMLRSLVGEAEKPGLGKLMKPVLTKVGQGVNPFPWIFGSDPAVCKQASPLAHVRKGMPPFLLLTAEREVPRLRLMAGEFEAALKKAGNEVTYRDLDDYTHKTIVKQLHANDNEVCELVLGFVARHAGKAEKPGK